MPTTLPARWPHDAERQAIAADLATVSRSIKAARRSGGIGLPLFLLLRLDLWLIRARLKRLRRRRNALQP